MSNAIRSRATLLRHRQAGQLYHLVRRDSILIRQVDSNCKKPAVDLITDIIRVWLAPFVGACDPDRERVGYVNVLGCAHFERSDRFQCKVRIFSTEKSGFRVPS